MYRLLPFLFLLAVVPESEKNLEKVGSFVLSTKDSVASIKNGMDSFHATMMPLMMATQPGVKPEQSNQPPSPGAGENNARS